MADAMALGMDESRAQIIKIFSTSKWNLKNLTAHSAKKKIRSAANKASAMDADEAAFGGNPVDYYATLKARAAWLKAH